MTMTIATTLSLTIAMFLPSSLLAQKKEEMKPYTETLPGTKITFEMAPIPAGTFLMGSPAAEKDRKKDEGPQIEVEIDALWMGRHEVTWTLFNEFTQTYQIAKKAALEIPRDRDADAVSFPTPLYQEKLGPVLQWGVNGKMPAVCMTQFAAKQFTKWLSQRTGHFYRLPTEAEWEYAARATTTTRWSFGDDPAKLNDHAWHLGNSEERYHEVGKKRPNPWGLYDVHGNVAEWVIDAHADGHDEKFTGKRANWREVIHWPTALDPRVVRGGHFEAEAADCRSAARWYSDKSWKEKDPQLPKSIWWQTDIPSVGFRIVRPAKEPGEEEKRKFWDADLDSIRRVLKNELQAKMIVERPREPK